MVLQATADLTVTAPINLTIPGQALTLQAGNNLLVQAGGPITTKGNITLSAGDSTISKFNPNGGLTLNDTVSTSAGTVQLSANMGGITLNSDVGGTTVNLISAGTISQSGGTLSAVTLTGQSTGGVSNSGVTLTDANDVSNLGSFDVNQGSFTLTSSGVGPGLAISGPVTAEDIAITGAPSITTTGPRAPRPSPDSMPWKNEGSSCLIAVTVPVSLPIKTEPILLPEPT